MNIVVCAEVTGKMEKVTEKIKTFVRNWTLNATWSTSLEPSILVLFAAYQVVEGAKIKTDLLYRKICEERSSKLFSKFV